MWKRGCAVFGGVLCVAGAWVAVSNVPNWDRWKPLMAMRGTVVAAALVITGLIVLVYARRSTGNAAADFRRARERYPRRLGLGIGLVLAALLFGAAEVGFRVHEKVAGIKPVYTRHDPPLYDEHELLGIVPTPSIVSHSVRPGRSPGDDPLFEVDYTIDERGFRAVPSSSPGAPEVVAFFGCSYTFGEGVEDDETLPSRFGLSRNGTEVHNFAFAGYGPHHMFTLLRHDIVELDGLLRNRPAVGVYVYMDNHVQRAIGSMSVVTTWSGTSPCYELEDDGSLSHRGTFFEARQIRTWVDALVAGSRVARRVNVDIPIVLDQSHFDLVAALVAESAALFVAGRPERRFVFVHHPNSELDERLVEALGRHEIEILDYAGLYDRSDAAYIIDGDGHPSAAANGLLGPALAEDL